MAQRSQRGKRKDERSTDDGMALSYLLTLVTLGCLAASSSQPGHHGVSAISSNLHDPGCY